MTDTTTPAMIERATRPRTVAEGQMTEDRAMVAQSCCAPLSQETCCAPSDKATCCAPANAAGTCGCH